MTSLPSPARSFGTPDTSMRERSARRFWIWAKRAWIVDCRSVLVRTDSGVAAVLGMDDVVVVRSGDAVLVCPRARSEEVKGVLEEVRRRFPALA